MVVANGFPKCGNHALVKALELLGYPCDVNHFKYGTQIDGKHVFIKRDPRNVIVSWLRFNGNPVTPGMFIAFFRKFDGRPLVEEMEEYVQWLHDPETLVVKFEDLISSDAEMKRIAEWLHVPYLDGAFEELPGLTVTWNPEHSDYRLIWTQEVQDVWTSEGGTQLLAEWGY